MPSLELVLVLVGQLRWANTMCGVAWRGVAWRGEVEMGHDRSVVAPPALLSPLPPREFIGHSGSSFLLCRVFGR